MSPYRTDHNSSTEASARAPRDVAVSALVLAVGALGVGIGILHDRSSEAGVGTLFAIFGASAIARAFARRP